MKKVLSYLIIVAMLLSFASCTGKKEKRMLYFSDANYTELLGEKVKIDNSDDLSVTAQNVMNALLAGPSDAKHKSVIPEGTTLISVSAKGGEALVNLSQEFEKESSDSKRLLAIYSIVKTLSGIPGISRVKILINGRGLYDSNGQEMDTISMNDVILLDEVGKNQAAVFSLYYGTKDRDKLIAEERMVDVKDNETAEKAAITALLSGPKTHKRLISKDVKLILVERKETTCYVNLSKEFMAEQNDKLSIYSIVNTLTSLPEIEEVQFLIEGERAGVLDGIDLSKTLRRNNDIIKN